MSPPAGGVPYWRLSASYAAYFGGLGALIPYFGLYLASLGYEPTRIGVLGAALVFGRVVAPQFWGWVADRTGSRVGVVRWTSAVACVAFASVLQARGLATLALALLVFGFFWSASLPQLEATTLSHLGADTGRYSRVRLWGSLGFIASVAAVGALIETRGTGVIGPVVVGLLSLAWLATLALPEADVPRGEPPARSLTRVALQPPVLALLAVCFLMQVGHGPYYAFYSLYLEQFGYSKTAIGQLWSLGVLAEIGVFLVMHRLLSRWSLEALLVASTVCGLARWSLIALGPEHLSLLLLAQLLHAGTFGLHHAAAILLVHRYFVGRHQGRGQGLYSGLSYGLGGAVGSALGGVLWDAWGASAAFLGAALASVAALAAAAWCARGGPGADAPPRS